MSTPHPYPAPRIAASRTRMFLASAIDHPHSLDTELRRKDGAAAPQPYNVPCEAHSTDKNDAFFCASCFD